MKPSRSCAAARSRDAAAAASGSAIGLSARRRLRHARERRHLGQRQLVHGLAVNRSLGGGDAIGALAEADDVQVQAEDLGLGELLLSR